MKKILLLFLLAFSIHSSAQITKTGRKFTFYTPTFDTTLNAYENMFDHVLYAAGSKKWDSVNYVPIPTVYATNSSQVGSINTKKGGWYEIYKGNGGSVMYPITKFNGLIPTLIDTRYISFYNVPAIYYEQYNFTITTMAPTREMWLVQRFMPGQRYEEMLAGGGNASLLGDLEFSMRAVNPSYGSMPNSTFPEVYKTHILRIRYTTTTAYYYKDGVYQDSVNYQGADIPYIKNDAVMGVTSNNAVWDFAAQYYKIGNFSDADAAAIQTSLAAKWQTGVLPNQILLGSMGWSHDATKFTPFATVTNTPAGITVAAQSAWDYQWYQDDGTLGNQVLWSTAYQPLVSSYNPALGIRVKVCIRPKSTTGSFQWRFLDGGPYTVYTP